MFANELDYLRCVEPPHIDNPPMSFIMLLKSSHVGHNMSLLEGFAHLVIVMGPTPSSTKVSPPLLLLSYLYPPSLLSILYDSIALSTASDPKEVFPQKSKRTEH